MAVQLFTPNIDAIRLDAQQARDYEKRRKEEGDLKWGDLVEGDNILRLLPPTNSRGILWKLVSKHYFNDTSLRMIPTQMCMASMFPEVAGVHCPICAVGDKLRAQFPQIDISRWHKAGNSYYVQALDRKDTEHPNVAKLYRLTPSLKNWLSIQLDALLADGVDPTSLDAGFDIKITKETKQTRRGKRTTYTPTLWSHKGLLPLHGDPQVVQAILETMVNPDDIWKFPDDAVKSELIKAANDILQFYLSSTATTTVPINNPLVGGPPSATQIAQQIAAAAPLRQAPTSIAPQQPPAFSQQVSSPTQQVPESVSASVYPRPHASVPPPVTESIPLQQVPTQLPLPSTPGSPSDKPLCFAGASPRADGGVGYNPEIPECLMCPVEMACLDESKRKGVDV